jgi:tetratricopeptide (TPR) repeat protein
MNRSFASSLRLIAAAAFLMFSLAGTKLAAQGREYGVTNPYLPDRVSIQQYPQVGSSGDGVRRNTKVERFLQTAESALKASPPRYSEAEYALKFAISSDREDPEAYFDLGYVYFVQRRYKDAAEVYQRAVEIQPKWPESHYNLGLTYARLNKKKEALRELKALQGLKSKLADRLSAALH